MRLLSHPTSMARRNHDLNVRLSLLDRLIDDEPNPRREEKTVTEAGALRLRVDDASVGVGQTTFFKLWAADAMGRGLPNKPIAIDAGRQLQLLSPQGAPL